MPGGVGGGKSQGFPLSRFFDSIGLFVSRLYGWMWHMLCTQVLYQVTIQLCHSAFALRQAQYERGSPVPDRPERTLSLSKGKSKGNPDELQMAYFRSELILAESTIFYSARKGGQ